MKSGAHGMDDAHVTWGLRHSFYAQHSVTDVSFMPSSLNVITKLYAAL